MYFCTSNDRVGPHCRLSARNAERRRSVWSGRSANREGPSARKPKSQDQPLSGAAWLVVCARRCAPSHRWRDVSAPPNQETCSALRARGPAGREARALHSTVTLFARFLELGLWLRPGLSALHIAGAM
jgi:hypothetical protein